MTFANLLIDSKVKKLKWRYHHHQLYFDLVMMTVMTILGFMVCHYLDFDDENDDDDHHDDDDHADEDDGDDHPGSYGPTNHPERRH